MQVVKIKPLSVNKSYTGRRFQTDRLKAFKKHLSLLLKPLEIPEGKIALDIEFGFSSKGSDLDNGLKTFLDCLQKKYGFNDNRIYKMVVTKEIVKKGSEYIKFSIYDY